MNYRKCAALLCFNKVKERLMKLCVRNIFNSWITIRGKETIHTSKVEHVGKLSQVRNRYCDIVSIGPQSNVFMLCSLHLTTVHSSFKMILHSEKKNVYE